MDSKPIDKLSSTLSPITSSPPPKSSTTPIFTTECSTTECSTTKCSTTECSTIGCKTFTPAPTSSIYKDMSSIDDTLPIISNNLENYIQINNLNDIQYIENKYLIISKKNCIFCDKSKDLLKEKNISYTVMNCDNVLNGQKNVNIFLEYMCQLIGYEYMTFPMIFFDKKFIGGFKELVKHVD